MYTETGFCLLYQVEPTQGGLVIQVSFYLKSKSKSHYGQSVLVSGAHLGPATNFSISLRFSFRQFVCYVVAPSLTRGQVCNLL
jgi:hypothetical protein